MRGCKSDRIEVKLCADCKHKYNSEGCKRSRRVLGLKVVNGVGKNEKEVLG